MDDIACPCYARCMTDSMDENLGKFARDLRDRLKNHRVDQGYEATPARNERLGLAYIISGASGRPRFVIVASGNGTAIEYELPLDINPNLDLDGLIANARRARTY